ncbi:MAG TPA: FAD-dependent monooxygenase, partial [Candidatus Angelobacter sp.]|nr:FAD-dependent monooxygenase [Candidatus Angelobacter sp.]
KLDPILVDAAVQAGAELRENFTVKEVLWEKDRVVGICGHGKNGSMVAERARITVGADGMFSVVAKAVQAPEYKGGPALEGSWYAYFSGVPMVGWHLWLRPGRVIFAYNTNDNLSLIGVAFAAKDLPMVRANIEKHHSSVVAEHAPELWERMCAGKRESRYVGGAIPSHVRKPYGPGWALAGDAGYQKDPCTASGVTDAFSSAELLAEAIDAGLSGRQPPEQALACYEQTRNQAELPYFDLTTQLSALEPPPAEVQQLLQALCHNPEQRSRFFGVLAHTVPVTEFFSAQNIKAIFGTQKAAGAGHARAHSRGL